MSLSNVLTSEEIDNLVLQAKQSRDHAFVPRSGHRIGASVLTATGEAFAGCNTEAIIAGLGTCAERSAVDHAVAHGHYSFRAVATIDSELTYPCGACLQYLLQFYQVSGQKISIVVADLEDHVEIKSLTELLPFGYLTKSNLDKLKSYGAS